MARKPAKHAASLASPEQLARIASEILDIKERGKALYREADRKLAELRKMGVKHGQVIELGEGKSAKFVDNLSGGETTAHVNAYFRRYELK